MQSECASSEEIQDLLPWYTLLHQNTPFSWLWKYQWLSFSTLFLLSSTWSWSSSLVHFVAFSFTVCHCWVFDLPECGCRWENQSKIIKLWKMSVNKGRVEEGLEKILPTCGYRFELLTHSDSPPNKCIIPTLLFFWNWVGHFLTGMYIFPFTYSSGPCR